MRARRLGILLITACTLISASGGGIAVYAGYLYGKRAGMREEFSRSRAIDHITVDQFKALRCSVRTACLECEVMQ